MAVPAAAGWGSTSAKSGRMSPGLSGLPSPTGAIVVNVFPGSPAANAGILAGDVILTFNGKTVPNSRKLPQIVAATDVGRAVDVTVWRKGKGRMSFKVQLGELEKATLSKKKGGKGATPDGAGAILGMQLARMSPALKRRYRIAATTGVVVVNVSRGSEAARKGIRPGHVILELDLVEVKTPAAVRKLLAKARKERKRAVLVLMQRGQDRNFVSLRIAK